MGIKEKLEQWKKERLYKSSAEAQIKKKAQAAYYKAREKEAIIDAQRKAKSYYSPKPKSSSGGKGFLSQIAEGVRRSEGFGVQSQRMQPLIRKNRKTKKSKLRPRRRYTRQKETNPFEQHNPFWD